jgi:hypothetical protein
VLQLIRVLSPGAGSARVAALHLGIARAAIAGARWAEAAASVAVARQTPGAELAQVDAGAAEQAFAQQAAVAGAHGLQLWRLRALHELGTIDPLRTESVGRLEQARELAVAQGALALTATLDLQIAAGLNKQFRAGAALAAAQRSEQASRRFQLATLPMALIFQATAHAIRGERHDMEARIAQATALAPDDPDVLGSSWGHCRATLCLLAENLEEAHAQMATGAGLLLSSPAAIAPPFLGLWPLLGALLDRDAEAAAARVRAAHSTRHLVVGSLLGYANAIFAGRRGERAAEAAFAAADGQMGPLVTWYRHYARRCGGQCPRATMRACGAASPAHILGGTAWSARSTPAARQHSTGRRAARRLPHEHRIGENPSAPDPTAASGVLVDSAWLHARLRDPAVRVVEVDVSRAAYDQWHIDGAVLWNVYADLKDPDYRLIGPAAAERLFTRSGIGPGTTVVCYGYAPAMGLWLMKLYGHADVRILDCSRGTWQAEGLPCSSTATRPRAASYPLGEQDARVKPRYWLPPATWARRSSASAPGTSTGADGSGPPAAWSQEAAPGTFPPRSTCPSTTSTTTAEPSAPPPTCAASSPLPIPVTTASSSPTAPSAGGPALPGSSSPTCSAAAMSASTTDHGPSGAAWQTPPSIAHDQSSSARSPMIEDGQPPPAGRRIYDRSTDWSGIPAGDWLVAGCRAAPRVASEDTSGEYWSPRMMKSWRRRLARHRPGRETVSGRPRSDSFFDDPWVIEDDYRRMSRLWHEPLTGSSPGRGGGRRDV